MGNTTLSGQHSENKNYELEILKLLRRIIQSGYLHSRQLKQKFDITTPQLVALLEISKVNRITMKDLASNIALSSSTLVGVIDRLEKKEFVLRKRDYLDRRKVFLSITAKGKVFVEKAPSPLQEALITSLYKVSSAELSTILSSLERIAELMNAKDLDESFIFQGDGF
jgi:DNA-binding MarR family transcriptional regulator